MDVEMEISICNVTNKENGEDLTVYTEWSDLKLKIVIAKTDEILEGEVLKQDFTPFAKTFEKPVSDFLKETQEILAGKDNSIDFFLKNGIFLWKKKKWSWGKIDVKPVAENSHVSKLFLDLLNKFSKNIKDLSETKEKGKNNEYTISELQACNNDLIKKKEQSELEWYKRSILMVNSKKEKIRDLKKKLEKYESEKDPIFYADTQNSESESENTLNSDIRHSNKRLKHCLQSDGGLFNKKTCDSSVQTVEAVSPIVDTAVINTTQKQSKRKPNNSEDDEETLKKKKYDISVQTEDLNEESIIKEKESLDSINTKLQLPSDIGEDEETPDFLTDESECEVELKFEDDKNHEDETQGNTMTREESSEELF